MQLGRSLAPRDRLAAARMAGVLTLVAAGMGALFNVILPANDGLLARASAIAVPAAVVLLMVIFRRVSTSWSIYLWVAFPVAGVAAIAAMCIITGDASAAGQVVLCYPVLYAASQLRVLGAALTTGAAIVADAVMVFSLLPQKMAVTDFCYMTGTLVTMAVLLLQAGDAQDRLCVRLRAQADMDPLTGLATRRAFEDVAQAAASSATQQSGTSLILMDVDRFKTINDTYGHPAGDAVLIHLAALLVANSRPNSVTCRMGGDELAIVLPGCSTAAAERRAEQFRHAIHATPFELPDGTLLGVSMSAGVAHIPSHAEDFDGLYQAADVALYEAKSRGGGIVVVAVPREAESHRS
jgi:diguanylate cyclase (GGDEF)-like protein